MANEAVPVSINAFRPIANEDRIVTIIRTRGSNKSWRQNLSSILDSQDNYKSIFYTDSSTTSSLLDTGKLDVSNNVHLLYSDSGLPSLQNKPGYVKPIADALKSITGNNETFSKYSGLALGAANAALALTNIGSEGTSSSFNPYSLNTKAWDPTSVTPIGFNYTFGFTMGQYGLWNAFEEVVKPILNLMAPTLLQGMSALTVNGPYPNSYEFLIEAFRDITDASGSESDNVLDKISGWFDDIINTSYKEYSYTVKFGKFMTFPDMLITESTVNFSNEVDNHGWPIIGSISLQFESIKPIALTADDSSRQAIRFGNIS